jgi:hypothetical protein
VAPWNHWSNYYPGNAYVDWVGMDGYNRGTAGAVSSWREFPRIFTRLYNDYAATKPVMVAETGSVEAGGDKAAWISNARAAIETQYLGIRAVTWFNGMDSTQSGGSTSTFDWRVTTSSTSLQAYTSMGHDPYFNGGSGVTPSPTPSPITSSTGASLKIRRLRLAPRPLQRYTVIRFRLNRRAVVHVHARRLSHRLRLTLLRARTLTRGVHLLRWTGRNRYGVRVPRGRYRITVSASRNHRTVRAWSGIRVLRSP